MLGGTRYLRLKNPAIVPFGGAMIGMAILENKEPMAGAESSSTNFAWQLKGGVNIMVSKQVGIKLQMHLLSAVQGSGGGLFLEQAVQVMVSAQTLQCCNSVLAAVLCSGSENNLKYNF